MLLRTSYYLHRLRVLIHLSTTLGDARYMAEGVIVVAPFYSGMRGLHHAMKNRCSEHRAGEASRIRTKPSTLNPTAIYSTEGLGLRATKCSTNALQSRLSPLKTLGCTSHARMPTGDSPENGTEESCHQHDDYHQPQVTRTKT